MTYVKVFDFGMVSSEGESSVNFLKCGSEKITLMIKVQQKHMMYRKSMYPFCLEIAAAVSKTNLYKNKLLHVAILQTHGLVSLCMSML